MHALFVRPDQRPLCQTVPGARPVIRGPGNLYGALARVVVQGETSARHVCRTTERIGETMVGGLVGVEDHGMVEQRRNPHDAVVHLTIPELDGASQGFVPW